MELIMSQESNKKLYVGSLPYHTTEEELKNLFGQFGPVSSSRIITDKFTGQSKGFGFVEMENADDAQKAIEAVNGAQLGGRTLVVNVARPPQEKERSPRGNGGGWRGGDGENRRFSRNRG